MNPWFKEFLSDTSCKQKQNYTGLISLSDSISDGINHLPLSALYSQMIECAICTTSLLNGYTQSAGHPLLVYGLRFYERVLAGMTESEDDFGKYIRVTAGASAAIQMVISYYANIKSDGKVFLCGMSYYLFKKCCQLHNLSVEVVSRDGGLLPQAKDVCEKMNASPGSCVILTHPANPSGEMYSVADLELILDTCRKTCTFVILDLCQYDEIITNAAESNPGKLIRKAHAQKWAVIINSFSKTRAIAGARIGYVVTQNEQLASYVEYCNEMLYFNHTLGCEYAILTDIFYRTILRSPKENHRRIIRTFRNIILQTAGVSCYQNVFSRILHSGTVLQDGEKFRDDILLKARIVDANFEFCKEELMRTGCFGMSTLDGGYNFCVRIQKPSYYSEEKCVQLISELMGTGVLSQQAFCLPVMRGAEHLWIRISAAMEQTRFRNYIIKLKEWSKQWN